MPTEKLSAEGILSARERYATLSALGLPDDSLPSLAVRLTSLLATSLELETLHVDAESPVESGSDANTVKPRGRTADTDAAFLPTTGGVLRAELAPDGNGCIAGAKLSGTVQTAPWNALEWIATALTGVSVSMVTRAVTGMLERERPDLLGFDTDDIVRVIELAAARASQRHRFGLDRGEVNTLMLLTSGDAADVEEVLSRAAVMLVPYCAKPVYCKWRHRDGCPECGECEVGDAYRLARERGMRVVTITNFEHLQETFSSMRRSGVEAYVGMCCGEFYLKRHRAFSEAAMSGVLLDISGANCYELGEEELAYQGRFAAQARLNVSVVEKVMHFVPPVALEVKKTCE